MLTARDIKKAMRYLDDIALCEAESGCSLFSV